MICELWKLSIEFTLFLKNFVVSVFTNQFLLSFLHSSKIDIYIYITTILPIFKCTVSSLVLNTFIFLCNHQHCSSLRTFRHPKPKLCAHQSVTLHPLPHPRPLATTIQISVPMFDYFKNFLEVESCSDYPFVIDLFHLT